MSEVSAIRTGALALEQWQPDDSLDRQLISTTIEDAVETLVRLVESARSDARS
jgi:predicted aldo/keto reductase-like oxidoreductase